MFLGRIPPFCANECWQGCGVNKVLSLLMSLYSELELFFALSEVKNEKQVESKGHLWGISCDKKGRQKVCWMW